MNFSGYVGVRRGLLAHLQDGKLSNTEALVLVILILLADKSTGSGTINAPTLRTFLPELSYDAAKRTLLSLEDKRYIFREIIPFSKRVYRFWVHRYTPSAGPHKLLQTDCSQAFETNDAKHVRYVKSAPEGAPEGALEGALHYEKGKGNQIQNPPISTQGLETSLETKLGIRQRTSSAPSGKASAEPSAEPCWEPVNSAPVIGVELPTGKADVEPSPKQVLKTLRAKKERWINRRDTDLALGRDVAYIAKFIDQADEEIRNAEKAIQ